MLYEFQLVGGTEVIEKYFRVAEAPEIGATIWHGGKLYRRIFSTPDVDAGVKQKVHGYPYVARNLPKGLPGAEADTRTGNPVITSQSHEREFAARHGLKRD